MYWNHCMATLEILKLHRWIVTLDVLKLKTMYEGGAGFRRWIVTLDVLKCVIEYENENLAIVE